MIYCLIDLGEYDVIFLYVYIELLMDLIVLCVACLAVFENCLVKQFTIFGCGYYFVVECYGSVECGGGALLDIPCDVWYYKKCVSCVCDSSVHLDAPSIGCVCHCLGV